MSILISIIIPSYNQGEFIENAIRSVLKQKYSNWELIIQDNCSQDRTCEMCERYSKVDERIKFFSESDNGFADAVNKGLSKCSGAVAGIQSSDDFYAHSGVFLQLENIWSNHEELFLISGRSIAVDAELRELPIPRNAQSLEDGFIPPEAIFTNKDFLQQESTFFSVKRALEIGGLDTELDMCADVDFWIRMAICRPVAINRIYRAPLIWGAVGYHDSRRSNDLSKFSLAGAKMWVKLWKNPEVDLHPRFKRFVASHDLDRALHFHNALGKDIEPLIELYKELHGTALPPKQILKAVLCKSAAFRWFRYRGRVQNSSQCVLEEYPPGYSVRWF